MANEQTVGQSLRSLANINPDTLTELADSISLTELDTLDGVTAGTVTASKAVVVDANLDIASFRHVTITGNLVTGATTLSETDLAKVDGITNGTVAASKAVVVDANKDAGDFRNLDVVNLDAGADAVAGTVDIFPTTTAKGKLIIAAADNAGATNITLTNASHGQATVVTIPDVGLATSYVVQSTAALTAAEANFLDGATAGTQVASKAVIADANVNTGISKVTALHIGASGSEAQVTVDVPSLNALVKFSQTVGYAAFTDGGAAVGTYNITAATIPIGATFVSSAVTAVTGFAGDTSAVLTIGDGSDVDRYNTSTVNVFATAANGIECGIPSGVRYHDAVATIKLTITTATDWTIVSAGSITVEFFYLT